MASIRSHASAHANREIQEEKRTTVEPAEVTFASVTGQKRVNVGRWYMIQGIFDWYPSYMPLKERRLVRKLDFGILSFCCVQFFLKYLDSSNVTNAYNSGMSDELHLFGNELNLFVVLYNCGYMVFQIPMLLLLSRPGFSRWVFPVCELLWGIVTFTESRVTSANQLYAIRFILGALESPSFSGTNYILASWYTGDELYKRAGTWFISSSLGSMFSGYLQTAAFKNLNGASGMAGWRWLFIVDGIITVPLAIFGFFMFPGLPSGDKPWYLTEEEHALAKERMAKQDVAPSRKLNWSILRRVLGRWHWWVAVALYVSFLNETYPTGYMSLFLKRALASDGKAIYSIPQVNNIPTGVQAVICISTWLAGSLVGVISIWPIMLTIQIIVLFCMIVLRVWHVPIGLKFVAYMMLGVSSSPNPLIFGLVNQMCRRDAEERAITIGSMMTFGWAFFAWLPLIIFPTVEAPQWAKGYTTTIILTFVATALFMLATVLHTRDEKKEMGLIKAAEQDMQLQSVGSMEKKPDVEHEEIVMNPQVM